MNTKYDNPKLIQFDDQKCAYSEISLRGSNKQTNEHSDEQTWRQANETA